MKPPVIRNVPFHWHLCTAAVVSLLIVHPSSAQTGATSLRPGVAASTAANAVTDFVARARAGTEQFRDRRVAIAAGYRRLGMDFPSMGEHWVNPGLVLSGDFDAARPAILSYVEIDGQPTLVGAVYAIPLVDGAKPPAVPGNAGMWHEHNGSVDDESLLPEHAAHQSGGQRGDSIATRGTRLAILHAWVGVPNPDGVFTAENWALPFARIGVPAPTSIPPAAARALSLASGAKEYFSALARSAGGDSVAIARALDEATHAAEQIAERAHEAHAITPMDISALNTVWELTLHKIGRDSGTAVATLLNGNIGPGAHASF
jgi:hypothetical protein